MIKQPAKTPAWVIRVIAGLFVVIVFSVAGYFLCEKLKSDSVENVYSGKITLSEQVNLYHTLETVQIVVIGVLVALWLIYAVVEFSLHKR